MKKVVLLIVALIFTFTINSCDDKDDFAKEPKLVIKFKFDNNQARLDNNGNPSVIPFGNAAQSPIFNSISSHYLELSPTANTPFMSGQLLYHGDETSQGGDMAIDFSKAKIVGQDEIFLEIPLKDIAVGNYQFIRSSLSYQNFKISVKHQGTSYIGTLASFVGFNTYIGEDSIGNATFPVNANKPQGYWEFALVNNPYSSSGQAPANATTVPNPINATSPTPLGSCVVTGKFETPLEITGLEKRDITLTLSLSINKSFEWKELTGDGKYEPSIGEDVIDMGLRGLIPTYIK